MHQRNQWKRRKWSYPAICNVRTSTCHITIRYINRFGCSSAIAPLLNQWSFFVSKSYKFLYMRYVNHLSYLVKINSNIVRPTSAWCFLACVHHCYKWSRVVDTSSRHIRISREVVLKNQRSWCCVHRQRFRPVSTRTRNLTLASIWVQPFKWTQSKWNGAFNIIYLRLSLRGSNPTGCTNC